GGEWVGGDVERMGGLRDVVVAQGHAAVVRVPEHGHPRRLRYRFLQELQTLRAEIGGLVGHTRDVAAGPREAVYEADAVGIPDLGHNDGNGGRGMPCRRGGRAADGDDHVHAGRDELGRESREVLLLRLRPAAHVGHVLLLNVTQVVQSLTQRQRRGAIGRSCAAREEADAPSLGVRLRITVRRAGEQGEREQDDQYYARHHLRFFVLARFGALAGFALAV